MCNRLLRRISHTNNSLVSHTFIGGSLPLPPSLGFSLPYNHVGVGTGTTWKSTPFQFIRVCSSDRIFQIKTRLNIVFEMFTYSVVIAFALTLTIQNHWTREGYLNNTMFAVLEYRKYFQ